MNMTRQQEAGVYLSLLDVMVGGQPAAPAEKKRSAGTALHKYIIDQLFNDAYIVPFTKDSYRLKSKEHHPLRKFYEKTFKAIKPLLRKKKGKYVLAKIEVIRLHGNSYAKQKYRSLKTQNTWTKQSEKTA